MEEVREDFDGEKSSSSDGNLHSHRTMKTFEEASERYTAEERHTFDD
jgi:hypothetical protein